MSDLWTWRQIVVVVPADTSEPNNPIQDTDVTGFDVVAPDGAIGKVDEATYDAGGSYLVVDTGFWIFGKKRMVPAGVVERVDSEAREVHVRMTKEEVKAAPDYDPDRSFKDQQDALQGYYRN